MLLRSARWTTHTPRWSASLRPLGYHILCEKPMANSIKDCVTMVNSVRGTDQIVGYWHVMRYSPTTALSRKCSTLAFWERSSIFSISSLSAGNTLRTRTCAAIGGTKPRPAFRSWPSAVTIWTLSFYMGKDAPKKVSSFGSLAHFKPSKKPKEAGDAKRCTDCAYERKCPFSAKKIYLEPLHRVMLRILNA